MDGNSDTWSAELVVYIVSREISILLPLFSFYPSEPFSEPWSPFCIKVKQRKKKERNAKTGALVSLELDLIKGSKIVPRFRGREKPWQQGRERGGFKVGSLEGPQP